MLVLKWWFFVILFLMGGLMSGIPTLTQAITLEGYFKVISLASKKRDMWRKIFFGQDLGFEASPWLFKDRVKPPFVPIVKSFPKYPEEGHYWNERGPPSSQVSFPDLYSHLQLSPRLPPPPQHARNYARSYYEFSPNQPAPWYRRWNATYIDRGVTTRV